MSVRSHKTPIGIGELFMILRWIVTALTEGVANSRTSLDATRLGAPFSRDFDAVPFFIAKTLRAPRSSPTETVHLATVESTFY